jgi:hypothetical protein
VVLTPVADAYVFSTAADTNYGTAPTLYVGSQTVSATGRALFRFDLGAIPPGATLTGASFHAYLVSTSPSPPSLYVEARQILKPWIEKGTGSVTWNNQPGTASIGKSNGVGTAPAYYDWEVTGLVQDWLSGVANYGLELMSTTEGTVGWRGLASRESVSPPYPPRLVISYWP